MYRCMFFASAGGVTLLWALANPEPASAQKGPGKSFPGGFRTGGMQTAMRPLPPKPMPGGFRPGVPPQNFAMPRPNPGFKVLPGTNGWRDSDRLWRGGWPGRDENRWRPGCPRRYGRMWQPPRYEFNTTNNNSSSSSSSSAGGGGYPVFVGGAISPGFAGGSDGAVLPAAAVMRGKEPPYRETFVEDRERIYALKLELARGTSEMSEIVTGVHHNVLLDDLRRFSGKIALSSTPLSEDILMHINVTTMEHHGNLGLLRNGCKLSWPIVLELDKVLSKQERNDLELKLQRAVQQALQGNVPRANLADVKDVILAAGDKLVRNGRGINSGEYLRGKRFLEHLDAARIALENDEAPAYFQFQKWVRGGKTIQDVAGYMAREGLQFAPALSGDERAYRAVHSALAAYDVAVNQIASPLASAVSSKQ